jgi:hypothetical protein
MSGEARPARDHGRTASVRHPGDRLYGLLAEFENVEQLFTGVLAVRKGGYTRWDVHSPFPVHGMDGAMGVRRTRLPWLVFIMGLCGTLTGLLLVWWTNVTSYPLPHDVRGYPFLVAGKPVFSLPANIPVIFETTVLLAAFGAVFGMLGLNRLPMLFNPLLKSERFRRVTQDRFFISIQAADPRFDRSRTADLLLDAGAKAIEEVQD